MPATVTQRGTATLSGAGPISTASLDFADGGALIAAVSVIVAAGGTNLEANLAVSGGGVTWMLLGSATHGLRRRVWLFKGEGTVADGEITATYTDTGSGAAGVMSISVAQTAGQAVSTPFGTAAAANGSSGTAEVTIPGVADTDDVCFMAVGLEGDNDITFEAVNWAELSDFGFSSLRRLGTAWSAGHDQTASATFTSTNWGVVGVLIQGEAITVSPAAVAGVGAIPTPTVEATGAVAVGPTAVHGTSAVPKPTIQATGTPPPASVAGVGAIPTPTVAPVATPTPAAVGAVGAAPTPGISQQVFVGAAVVSALTQVMTPSFAASAMFGAAAVAALVAIPSPSPLAAGVITYITFGIRLEQRTFRVGVSSRELTAGLADRPFTIESRDQP